MTYPLDEPQTGFPLLSSKTSSQFLIVNVDPGGPLTDQRTFPVASWTKTIPSKLTTVVAPETPALHLKIPLASNKTRSPPEIFKVQPSGDVRA